MKRNIKSRQAGIAHLTLIVVLVLGLVGVLGFVGYNAFQKQNTNAGGKSTLGKKSQKQAALPKPNKAKCKQLARVWSQGICAWSGSSQKAPTKYCVKKSLSYVKAKPYDYCAPPPENDGNPGAPDNQG